MINVIGEFVECVIMGIWTWFVSLFKLIPVFDQLSGLKEEIIAAGLGIPAIVVSTLSAIPLIAKISFKIIDWLS